MLIVHLSVSYSHVNLCHVFASSWYQGSAATSACGSSWTFLFTFFFNQRIFFYMLYILNFAGYFKPAIRLRHKAVFAPFIERKKLLLRDLCKESFLCVPFPRITLLCKLYVYYPTQKAPGEF